MSQAMLNAFAKSLKKPTQKERILDILSDGQWHNATEFATKIGWRFGGVLHEIRKETILEKRTGDNGYDDWRKK